MTAISEPQGGLWRGISRLLVLSWREDPRRTTIAAILMLLAAVALPFSVASLRVLTDQVIAGNVVPAALAAAVGAVLLIFALTAGHFAHIYYFELGEAAQLVIQRRLIMISNGSAGLEHHDRADYADRLQVLGGELNRTQDNVHTLFAAFTLAVSMLVTALLLAFVSPWLLLLPVAAIPPLLLGRQAEGILGRAREVAASSNRRAKHLLHLSTTPGPAKELRVCGLDDELRTRQKLAWRDGSRILGRANALALLPWLGGQLFFALAYVAATLVVVAEAVSGRASVGDVILVIVLAGQVNQQVSAAVATLQELQRSSRAMRTLDWMEDLVSREAIGVDEVPVPTRIDDAIVLHDVGFGYPGTDTPVLSGVNLRLPAGGTVAIVGENGAGKTSLVKLLCRFYEADAGSITVDGVDLRRFPVDAWRERVSAGFQDFTRFELTAQRSVGVGFLPELDSESAVTEALARARSEALLERLEDGLATPLGKSYQDGTELSGGQWQKVALGRAMMRQSPLLLVLDEPTAALDAQAEHELFEQYAQNARRVGALSGAVTVLVSHRFSTVRMADLIVVIAGGRVAESGSHDELLARGGLYAELYELQAAAYR